MFAAVKPKEPRKERIVVNKTTSISIVLSLVPWNCANELKQTCCACIQGANKSKAVTSRNTRISTVLSLGSLEISKCIETILYAVNPKEPRKVKLYGQQKYQHQYSAFLGFFRTIKMYRNNLICSKSQGAKKSKSLWPAEIPASIQCLLSLVL